MPFFRIPVTTQEPILTTHDITERIQGAMKVTSITVIENYTGNGVYSLQAPVGHYYVIRAVHFTIAGAGVTNPVLTFGIYSFKASFGGTGFALYENTLIGDGADKTQQINIAPNLPTWDVYNDPIRKRSVAIPDVKITDRNKFIGSYFGAATQFRIIYDDYEAIV